MIAGDEVWLRHSVIGRNGIKDQTWDAVYVAIVTFDVGSSAAASSVA